MNRYLQFVGCLVFIVLTFITINVIGFGKLTNLVADLTADKSYTLTTGTIEILKGLDSPVNLYYYNSVDIQNVSRETYKFSKFVQNALEAYQLVAPDKIILHVVDPRISITDAAQANAIGLQSLQMLPNGGSVFFGLAGVNARGETQVIPLFQEIDSSSLEFKLSMLVRHLATPERPKLGLISGLPIQGGFDEKSGKEIRPWLLLNELYKDYDVENVSPEFFQIPSSIKVLLVVHPKKLSMANLFAIDQFVMRGGRLLAFVDPFSEQDTGEKYFGIDSMDRSSTMDLLFSRWGIELVPRKVVGDSLYAMEASRDPRIQSVRLPTALGLPRQALNRSDVSISGLAAINMTTAGAIKVVDGAKTRFTPLIQSSSSSFLFDTDRFFKRVVPEEMIKEIPLDVGVQHVMAARIQGKVRTAFPHGFDGHPSISLSFPHINVVVVADTDLLTDRMWAQVRDVQGRQQIVSWADNERFVLNVLDDLFDADELIEARNRGAVRHVFEKVENLRREIPILRVREASLKNDLSSVGKLLEDEQDPVKSVKHEADVRQELLKVKSALLENEESLGIRIKVLNIALIPLSMLVIMFTCKWGLSSLMRRNRKGLILQSRKS